MQCSSLVDRRCERYAVAAALKNADPTPPKKVASIDARANRELSAIT